MPGPVHEVRLQPFKIVLFIFVILLFVSLSFLAGYRAGSSGKTEEKMKQVSWEEAYSLQPSGEEASPAQQQTVQEEKQLQPEKKAPEKEKQQLTEKEATASGESPAEARISGYVVQVAAFRSQKSALSVAEKYRQKGYPAFVRQETIRGRKLFKVYIGPFSSSQQARSMKKRLERKERKKFLLRRLD